MNLIGEFPDRCQHEPDGTRFVRSQRRLVHKMPHHVRKCLPGPVSAIPMTSHLAMIHGRHCAWMGNGAVMPCFSITFKIRWESSHCSKEDTGAGVPCPRTFTLIFPRIFAILSTDFLRRSFLGFLFDFSQSLLSSLFLASDFCA
jgi:hypothetical protein